MHAHVRSVLAVRVVLVRAPPIEGEATECTVQRRGDAHTREGAAAGGRGSRDVSLAVT